MFAIGGAESAVPAKSLLSLEKAASSREIRACLGQRLGEYRDSVRQIPVSERLTEVLEQLVQRLEDRERKPEEG